MNLKIHNMNKEVKWAAELAHVREVSLIGLADLAYWKKRLLDEDLVPAERDGQAQLMMIAAEGRYMGVRFREMSFSVLVSWPEGGSGRDAAYLVQAFNSVRFFALVERALFSTPYSHGDVRVSPSLPACVQVALKGTVAFRAEMAGSSKEPGRSPAAQTDDGWEGPVFLPRGKVGQAKVFVAKLRGKTQTYPFLPSADSLVIHPTEGILQALVESQFVAKEWIIREDAAHAKSVTYRRIAGAIQ